MIDLTISAPYEYSKLHPYLDATFSDIFRKMDLECNSQLDANELKVLGRIIDNKYFKQILQKDFTTEKFNKI